jgi:cell division protein FtsB
MTAPTKSRRRNAPATRGRGEAARTPTTVEPDPRTAEPGKAAPRRASRGRTSAAERAYARRAQRADLLKEREPRPAPKTAGPGEPRVRLKLRLPKSRASFVLLMMALLAAGVATTLWLTTQAIADSYRLEQLRTTNSNLAETKEQLQREVAKAESPASLAPAAQQLGMVPGGDPARILVGPDGKTSLVGEPKKAKADTPAVPVAPPAAPAAGTQSQQGAPIEGDQPAVPADEQPAPPAQPDAGR